MKARDGLKGIGLGRLAFLGLLLLALPLVALAEIQPAEDGRQLDHFKEDKNNRVVTYNHSSHIALGCETCHHNVDAKVEKPQVCASAGCHDVMDKKDKSPASYYSMIHAPSGDGIKGCVGCHKDLDVVKQDNDKRKLLTSCKGSACHP